MKICEICKTNEGIIRVTEVMNGAKTQRWVCEECSGDKLQMIGKLLSDFTVGGPASPGPGHIPPPLPPQVDPLYMGELPCKTCGLTHEELVKVQKLGCPNCYEAFEKVLDATLRCVHGARQHTGKVPGKHTWNVKDLESRIETLEAEMDKAAKAEAYEKAAETRDQINNLRTQREELLKEQE